MAFKSRTEAGGVFKMKVKLLSMEKKKNNNNNKKNTMKIENNHYSINGSGWWLR